jgi:AraC-like DNA-binding protein
MGKINYIRHLFGKERQTSDKPDLFYPRPGSGVSYQDVVSFSDTVKGRYCLYTIGKNIFPGNHELNFSMQRWMIVFLVNGGLFYGVEELQPGDYIVGPPSCIHTYLTKKETAVFYWCTTNDPSLEEELLRCGYHHHGIVKGHVSRMQPVTDLFEQTIYRFPEQCNLRLFIVDRLTCLFSFIDSNVVQSQNMSEQVFRRCLQRIESTRGNVTVEYLSKHYFISRRHLYSLFREYKNMSPTEYIYSVRMRIADQFLVETDYTIAKIAEQVGYSNYVHFTRAYTKYFSIAPSQRRKQAKMHTESVEVAGDSSVFLDE